MCVKIFYAVYAASFHPPAATRWGHPGGIILTCGCESVVQLGENQDKGLNTEKIRGMVITRAVTIQQSWYQQLWSVHGQQPMAECCSNGSWACAKCLLEGLMVSNFKWFGWIWLLLDTQKMGNVSANFIPRFLHHGQGRPPRSGVLHARTTWVCRKPFRLGSFLFWTLMVYRFILGSTGIQDPKLFVDFKRGHLEGTLFKAMRGSFFIGLEGSLCDPLCATAVRF